MTADNTHHDMQLKYMHKPTVKYVLPTIGVLTGGLHQPLEQVMLMKAYYKHLCAGLLVTYSNHCCFKLEGS